MTKVDAKNPEKAAVILGISDRVHSILCRYGFPENCIVPSYMLGQLFSEYDDDIDARNKAMWAKRREEKKAAREAAPGQPSRRPRGRPTPEAEAGAAPMEHEEGKVRVAVGTGRVAATTGQVATTTPTVAGATGVVAAVVAMVADEAEAETMVREDSPPHHTQNIQRKSLPLRTSTPPHSRGSWRRNWPRPSKTRPSPLKFFKPLKFIQLKCT